VRVRAALTTALEIVGIVATVAGSWLILPAAAVIVAGLWLVLIGWRTA
jgi:hypothetical protein